MGFNPDHLWEDIKRPFESSKPKAPEMQPTPFAAPQPPPSVYEDQQITRGMETGRQKGQELYGTTQPEVGTEISDVIRRRKERMDMSSPAATRALQMGNREIAGARSRAGQSGRKLSGGEESQIARSAQQGASEFQWQAEGQGLSDYQKLMGNIASNMNSMELGYAQLGKAGEVVQPPALSQGLLGGMTVICTEVYNQGNMDLATFYKDHEYGIKVKKERPEVYAGYMLWAPTVVRWMQQSKLVSKVVTFFALSWAQDMAGRKNLLGRIIRSVGEPICGVLGKLFGGKYETVKA